MSPQHQWQGEHAVKGEVAELGRTMVVLVTTCRTAFRTRRCGPGSRLRGGGFYAQNASAPFAPQNAPQIIIKCQRTVPRRELKRQFALVWNSAEGQIVPGCWLFWASRQDGRGSAPHSGSRWWPSSPNSRKSRNAATTGTSSATTL